MTLFFFVFFLSFWWWWWWSYEGKTAMAIGRVSAAHVRHRLCVLFGDASGGCGVAAPPFPLQGRGTSTTPFMTTRQRGRRRMHRGGEGRGRARRPWGGLPMPISHLRRRQKGRAGDAGEPLHLQQWRDHQHTRRGDVEHPQGWNEKGAVQEMIQVLLLLRPRWPCLGRGDERRGGGREGGGGGGTTHVGVQDDRVGEHQRQ